MSQYIYREFYHNNKEYDIYFYIDSIVKDNGDKLVVKWKPTECNTELFNVLMIAYEDDIKSSTENDETHKIQWKDSVINRDDIETGEKKDDDYWERLYLEKYKDNKYKKGSKNFSRAVHGKPVENPNIYIIPRQRGGPSYKDVKLEHDKAEDIQFCPVSKGYSMQDVSSFTLGPVIGHGLNVVNSAFSKCISIKHIDGSGEYNETHKKYWKNKKTKTRSIVNISTEEMTVNGVVANKIYWLENNKDLWYGDWKKWNDSIRLSPDGNFNWCDDSETIIYYDDIESMKYMDFVTWKKRCYIKPAYNLFNMGNNPVISFLQSLIQRKISIGLVHPMGKLGDKETAITREFIKELYNSFDEMTCMPYVVTGYLLDVGI